MLSANQIDHKWGEIRGGLRNLWAGLNDEELDRLKGDFEGIAELVQHRFGETRQNIQDKLESLIHSFENETDLDDRYSSSFHRSPLGPGAGATSDDQINIHVPTEYNTDNYGGA